MSDYTPISCQQYARYEQWIVRRQRLRMAWREHTTPTHLETLRPLDLRTRDHVEYLVVRRANGERVELRLDRILRAEPI